MAAHQHVADGVEGRVVHPTTKADFFLVEAAVVVRGGELDGVVVGEKCLQHNLARRVTATSASCDLGEQLERALGGAEVGKAERGVGADDADQRYVCYVVTFGNHLCADQQVDFARVECAQHAFEIVASPDRVAVEPRDARLRKQAVQDV